MWETEVDLTPGQLCTINANGAGFELGNHPTPWFDASSRGAGIKTNLVLALRNSRSTPFTETLESLVPSGDHSTTGSHF